MSRYRFRQSDIYLPGTEVPHNRLGLDNAELLHAIEAELLEQASQRFCDELTGATRFNETYFRSLHRRTFESLYDWAGEYRHEDMAKDGSLFCRGAYVVSESQRIFAGLLAEDFLRDAGQVPRERLAARLAFHQGELIALHPFHELNGRITRLFFDLIALRCGYAPVDYSGALAEGEDGMNDYIRASIACVRHADTALLERIVLAGLNSL